MQPAVPGRLLGGRYRLLDFLARGGMASVWIGEDTLLARRVAVKTLHPELSADDSLRARFRIYAAAPHTAPLPAASLGPDLPCTDDPELFFAESPDDVETAKALCRECPARAACLAGALKRREPWGVWGGELFLRGAIVPRKRPRGRPRKTDVAA